MASDCFDIDDFNLDEVDSVTACQQRQQYIWPPPAIKIWGTKRYADTALVCSSGYLGSHCLTSCIEKLTVIASRMLSLLSHEYSHQ